MNLSIIIPTLNEEHFLPNVLDELKDQTEHNFEVIVVDGNSEDNTKLVAEAYSKYFPIYVYSVDVRNVSYQRNFGASKSSTDHYCFLDADSRIEKTFVANVKQGFSQGELIMPYLTSPINSFFYKLAFSLINFYIRFSLQIKKPISAGGAMMISKNLFTKLNGFNDKIFVSEDHDLIKRAFHSGVLPIILNNIKVAFSLRRIEKEGFGKFMIKLIYSYFYYLIKGQIMKPIYNYEMGGKAYSKLHNKDKI